MKQILVAAFLCLSLLVACDCTTTRFYPASSGDVAEFNPTRSGKRERNRQLTKYIKDRTVLIQVDCTPKKGVAILGTSKPSLYGDGSGTGIIVRSTDEGSFIFTAAHVIEFAKAREAAHFDCIFYIQRADAAGSKVGRQIASLVVKSKNRDVAVLKVDINYNVSTALELNTFTGEDIWAAGFPAQHIAPGEKFFSITKGTLATSNLPKRGNPDKYGHYHRVTSQIYYGNSGGGLWSKDGKLIGIVTSMSTGLGDMPLEGYYYAKPVKELLDLLNKKGKYNEVFGD